MPLRRQDKIDKIYKSLIVADYLRLAMYQDARILAIVDIGMNYLFVSQQWNNYYQIQAQEGDNHYKKFPSIKRDMPQWVDIHQRVLTQGVQESGTDTFQGVTFGWRCKPIISDGGIAGPIGSIVGMIMLIHPKSDQKS